MGGVVEKLAGCRVVGEVGQGGMAVVYRAVQESLGRTVAIKVLKSDRVGNADCLARFEREAAAIASLQHENIPQLHELVKLDQGLGMVMEYVDGMSLDDLLQKRSPLPAEVAAAVALQVARALECAHARGLVHRDVKPSNILVGLNGVVKLTDFGIARNVSRGDLTQPGRAVGTPSFMSPEQILGDPLDSRSDLFALGGVLYLMLGGRKPFVENDSASIARKISLEEHLSLRRLNRRVPRLLQQIVDRCLRKRREERFGTTRELGEMLDRFVARRCPNGGPASIALLLRELGASTGDAITPMAFEVGRTPDAPVRKRRFARIAGMVVAACALTVGLRYVSSAIGRRIPASDRALLVARATEAERAPGRMRVVAEPWAEVFVDGKLLAMTPIARALPLPAGGHRIEFRNPHYETIERTITIRPGAEERVAVAFEPAR